MGTLNLVLQLKPHVSSNGAILKVKDEHAEAFASNKELNIGSSNDLFFSYSLDGKVEKSGMYQADRIIDFKQSGYYILIRSGSKWFDSRFDDWIKVATPFLEDALFFRAYDTNARLERYEIKNGVLDYRSANEPILERSHFDTYVLETYQSEPQLIADYFVDELAEIKASYDERLAAWEDTDDYRDTDDYEEYLEKIEAWVDNYPTESGRAMVQWLKDRIKELS